MNRIIYFRGYNLKNKKWLYGYYLVNRGKHYIVQDEVVDPFSEESDFEVDPESVGQFIGEYKGKPIFEGDILGVVARSANSNNFIVKSRGVVKYCGYNNSYRVENEDNHNPIIFDNEIKYMGISPCICYTYKLVGNEYEEKMKQLE